MALEDVEVDLDDDTLTVIPTPGTVEFGNTVSHAIGNAGVGARVEAGVGDGADSEDDVGARVGAGAGAGSVMSEKGQFQKKERQKTFKV
jgi:hypothetical protein